MTCMLYSSIPHLKDAKVIQHATFQTLVILQSFIIFSFAPLGVAAIKEAPLSCSL